MPMISRSAQEAFEFFAKRAIQGAFQSSPDDRCDVTTLDAASQVGGQRLVMLTVSSFLFRATTLVHFTMDAPLRSHLATVNRSDVTAMSEDDFLDVLGEIANILCGAFNRELAQHFPYLGMSTPNFLDQRCARYLEELGASFVRHFEVMLNDALTLHITFCVSEFADIDFHADTSVVEDSNGELEMF